MIGIRCPHCRQVLVYRELDPGDARKCPKCGEWFALPAEGSEERLCPRCQAGVAPDAASCGECGFGEAPGEALPLPRASVVDKVEPVAKKRRWLRQAAAAALLLVVLAALLFVFRAPVSRLVRQAVRALQSGAEQVDLPLQRETRSDTEDGIEGMRTVDPPPAEP